MINRYENMRHAMMSSVMFGQNSIVVLHGAMVVRRLCLRYDAYKFGNGTEEVPTCTGQLHQLLL